MLLSYADLTIDKRKPGELSPKAIQTFISRVHEEYFPELKLEYDVEEYSIKLSRLACAVVAYKSGYDDEILGAALGYCNNLETKEAYLSFFAKVKGSPKGLASLIHNEFLAMAWNYGMRTIALEVRKTNVHAIEFYRGKGYVFREDHGVRHLMGMTIPEMEFSRPDALS